MMSLQAILVLRLSMFYSIIKGQTYCSIIFFRARAFRRFQYTNHRHRRAVYSIATKKTVTVAKVAMPVHIQLTQATMFAYYLSYLLETNGFIAAGS